VIDPIAQAFRTPVLAKNARACPERSRRDGAPTFPVMPTRREVRATRPAPTLLSFRPEPERMRRRSGGTCCLSAAAKSLDFDPRCHPEEAESHAKRETPNEEPALSPPKDPYNQPAEYSCSSKNSTGNGTTFSRAAASQEKGTRLQPPRERPRTPQAELFPCCQRRREVRATPPSPLVWAGHPVRRL